MRCPQCARPQLAEAWQLAEVVGEVDGSDEVGSEAAVVVVRACTATALRSARRAFLGAEMDLALGRLNPKMRASQARRGTLDPHTIIDEQRCRGTLKP